MSIALSQSRNEVPTAASGTALPTSDTQRELWASMELGGAPAALAFVEAVCVSLRGPLDIAALRAALSDVEARHEVLRATFSSDGAAMYVGSAQRATLRIEDLSALPARERASRRDALLDEAVTTPFQLRTEPPLRARLVRHGAEHHELMVAVHAMGMDRAGLEMLVSELGGTYGARIQSTELPPTAASVRPATPFGGAAGANAERDEATERYWVEALGSAPNALELPTDHPRPRERSFEAAREEHPIDAALLGGLERVSETTCASMHLTLLAALEAMLSRIGGQEEFVIGLRTQGGVAPDGLERRSGDHQPTVPLPVRVGAEVGFHQHLRANVERVDAALAHSNITIGALVSRLGLARDPSRVALIPVLVELTTRRTRPEFARLSAELSVASVAYDAFDLRFAFVRTEDGMTLETIFNRRLFERDTIRRWHDSLDVLLRALVAEPGTPLGKLPLLSAEERTRVLDEWNRTERPLAHAGTALTAFEEQVRRTPDAIAVRDAAQALSYRELDRRANQLAWRLREAGVGPEDRVGVCVERSARMPLALLAVWKAGAAYVPLDPEYPSARLEFIREDADIRVLLTERSLRTTFSAEGLERVWLDEERGEAEQGPKREDVPERLAYVLHTSGSTGKPKGVMIEQRSLLNFLRSMAEVPGFTSADVIVAVTTLSFDIAGLELFLPLSVGGQTVIATREVTGDGGRLATLLAECGASVLQATPATWRLLVEAGWRGRPGFKALCGGEALPRELASDLLSRSLELWNVYGPTETTVWSTCARIESLDGPITVGRPIANTTTYILDPQGQPVPIGAVGELYIGGVGVARGYLNRPDLTSERFLADPFAGQPGARMYRTGDLARYDAQGRIYFERRNDGQIKIRGFRIELGDVESGLETHPDVRQACSVVREVAPGDTRLFAYVVVRAGTSPSPAELKAHLATRVPPYMVPQHLALIEAMPLTPNGKVDRKALTEQAHVSSEPEEFVAPETQVQQELARIWCDLLGVPRVSMQAPFFDLGGHSMLAARMLARVRERLGVDIALRQVFDAQTIEALSAHVEVALLKERRDPSGPRRVVEEIEF